MMNETLKHSPLPWILDINQIRQPALSKRRRIVCPPDADGIRDAAYIVRCVNNYDALVEILSAVVDQAEKWGMVSKELKSANALLSSIEKGGVQ